MLTNWDQIKRETKKQKSDREVLESVTPAMPALMRTQKVLKKAAKMGADNGTTDDLRESVCKAVSGATEENGAESIGKALFNLTELARRLGVDAEQALFEACRAYIEQFGARRIKQFTLRRWFAPWVMKINLKIWRLFIMNKTELIAAVAEKATISKKDAENAVSAVIASITESLAGGEKVQIAGFGTFEVRERGERVGRDRERALRS